MDAHAHSETAATAHHDSPEEFKKHLRSYYVVFVALLCLTAITVGVSYLRLNRPLAITLALIIASIKAGLVAAVFMHLISEKKVIFAVLALTALFFALVLLLPSLTVYEHRHVITGMGG
jgi:cytochrome c oxidase subunit IV